MPNDWIQTDCALCGAKESRPILAVPHADAPDGVSHIVQCRSCGLRRLNPRPGSDAIGRYYNIGNYNAFIGRTRSPRKQAVWDYLRDVASQAPGRGRRWGIARPLIRPLSEWAFDINVPLDGDRQRRVIEVGCGYGDLLIYLKSRGCEVQGVDLDARAAAKGAESGVPIHVGNLCELHLSPATFDVAVLCHSLEHLPDPREQLRELARLLKPGGHLHIAVPNGDAVGLRLYGRDWAHLSHPLHFWYFDASSLAALVRESGFEPLKTYSTSRTHYLGIWKTRIKTDGLIRATKTLVQFLRESTRASDGGDVLRMVAVRRRD